MNNLVVKEKQQFMGVRIPVIEGGFGEGQKVILAKTIAEIHNNRLDKINDLIKNNKFRFNENELLDLKPLEGFRNFIKENGLLTSNRTENIFLLSERGYTKLVSMMDNSNDKKWEVMDKLIDEYFTLRAKQKNTSTLDLIALQVQAMKEIEGKVEEVDKKVDRKFEEIPLFVAEKKEITKLVNRKIVSLLGGKTAPAYKTFSKKAFADIYGEIHRNFDVPSTDCIQRKDLVSVKTIIDSYTMAIKLKEEIDIANNQIGF